MIGGVPAWLSSRRKTTAVDGLAVLPADGQRAGTIANAVPNVDAEDAVGAGNLDAQSTADIDVSGGRRFGEAARRPSGVHEAGETEMRKERAIEPALRLDVRICQRPAECRSTDVDDAFVQHRMRTEQRRSRMTVAGARPQRERRRVARAIGAADALEKPPPRLRGRRKACLCACT